MRELYKSGVRAEILFYLRDYGDTKRSSLVSVFAKYNARHVQRVVAKMIEDGELDEYKKPPEPSKTPVRYAGKGYGRRNQSLVPRHLYG